MSAYISKAKHYIPCSDIFDALSQEPMVAFLDSSLHNELGKYSIIGISPYHVLKESDGIFFIDGEKSSLSFDIYLKEYLKKQKEENPTNLPLVSGGIGYFSYDYGRKFEHIQTKHPKQDAMPEAMIVFYDCFFIEDIEQQELYFIANGKLQAPQKSIAQMKKIVMDTSKKKNTQNSCPNLELRELEDLVNKPVSKEEYKNVIGQVIEYIEKGHIYVMNLTQRLTLSSARAPYEVFERLQQHNPAPFSAYLSCEEGQLISASPERFLRVRDGKIETRPIKGTRKRGSTEAEDERLKADLEHSEKDKSELLMIVDLERNDLNRICEPGSVKVTELFQLETYATVFHLIANVSGTLQKDVDVVDILRATFPGGSITGAPKVRAMEIIDELESKPRGIYTGILGYISLNGDCDFNIAIRTALHQDGTYHIGVGGGITYESDTEFEYEETLQKAKALVEAIL
jgi:para-aminobenzoate synthetase component 1